jgi:hypothetical protein
MFKVGRSMLDVQSVQSVRRSSLDISPCGINATLEQLQNNLAPMGVNPAPMIIILCVWINPKSIEKLNYGLQ